MDNVKSVGVYLPWVTTVAAVSVAIYLTLKQRGRRDSDEGTVNRTVQKDNPKVVHTFDIEDLDKKAVYCRCWRSKKFPYCDGSHNSHNEATGDNVGPLIIQRRGN
ncbi:CDGSH iron-sulfur domain-containing protein 1-like isoform X1 [Dinothrombium tinctorium]|uniref:CDGSH iron-sulfur domain-containing protein 1-like isoform X1 n=1 Tax=Dinothrombium tinctorium TaxID=1965070 RepID=A0A443QL60_9ACAR|nr:CDGSH iron-sulfur domain-containing protein 1-like isoform X1 [Dinothrombium tinctorium]